MKIKIYKLFILSNNTEIQNVLTNDSTTSKVKLRELENITFKKYFHGHHENLISISFLVDISIFVFQFSNPVGQRSSIEIFSCWLQSLVNRHIR